MITKDSLNTASLPFVVEAKYGNLNFEKDFFASDENKTFLSKKLLECGALLFRGFEIYNESDFERFVGDFSGRNLLNYAGGASPRTELNNKVYTSTEYPPDLTLALHNELSYTDEYPAHLFFCCIIAPETGGETSLGDSRSILTKIDEQIVETFKNKKVRYIRNLDAYKGSGYSWQDAFETDDKQQVEESCRRIGTDFEWKENNCLRLSQIRPATAIHPLTGEEVWFNQAHGFHPSALDAKTYEAFISIMPEDDFRLNCQFGDGTPIPVEMLNHIRTVLEQETVLFQWQRGDVLVIDNVLAAHGRMPFTGPRKIILAMT